MYTTPGLSATNPVRDLSDLLTILEVPECDCPLTLSCPCGQACLPGFSPGCHSCVLGVDVCGPIPHHGKHSSCAGHCPHCQELCDCTPLLQQEPCEHMRAHDFDAWERASNGQPMTFTLWLTLLWCRDYDGYQDWPQPILPMMALDAAARAEVMRGRRAARVGLFDDAPAPSWLSGLAREARNHRNGAKVKGAGAAEITLEQGVAHAG